MHRFEMSPGIIPDYNFLSAIINFTKNVQMRYENLCISELSCNRSFKVLKVELKIFFPFANCKPFSNVPSRMRRLGPLEDLQPKVLCLSEAESFQNTDLFWSSV